MKKLGPFSYFRVKKGRKHFISAWLEGHENSSFGWEWGTDGTSNDPSFCLRLWHLNVFWFERYKLGGYMINVLGFWYMK